MYVTEKGTLTIEDPRSRSALRFNIGRQRGLVSSMVQMPNQYTTLIGTINGYLILYDIRSTLIVNLFQLINH
jgi:phosphoinositide-3-kinase regulatory subunit 4